MRLTPLPVPVPVGAPAPVVTFLLDVEKLRVDDEERLLLELELTLLDEVVGSPGQVRTFEKLPQS